MRRVLWLVFGLLLGGSLSLAKADTVPAQGTWTINGGQFVGNSALLACQSYATAIGGGVPSVGAGSCAGGTNCCTVLQGQYTYGNMPVAPPTSYTCPPGYTLNGASCVSNVTCPEAGTTVGAISGTGNISGGACLSGDCAAVNGCAVGGCESGASSGEGSAASWVFKGCKYSGAPGAAEQPTAAEYTNATSGGSGPGGTIQPADCLAKTKGYITSSSGTTSCVEATEAPDLKTTAKQTTTTTPAGGSPTTETMTTSENCAGGNCQVTRTDGHGNTTTADKSAFCEQNPNASVCKASDWCEKNPDAVGCMKAGDPGEADTLGEKSVGLDALPSVSFASDRTCPADVALPKGAVFKWTPICDAMGWLRPVVLAMAYLAAGLLVAGALRTE